MKIAHPIYSSLSGISRREALKRCGMGFGALALTALLQEQRSRAAVSIPEDLRPRYPHAAPAARAMIMLMQTGGPSNMDLFDHKPELTRRDGQAHNAAFETFQMGNT